MTVKEYIEGLRGLAIGLRVIQQQTPTIQRVGIIKTIEEEIIRVEKDRDCTEYEFEEIRAPTYELKI